MLMTLVRVAASDMPNLNLIQLAGFTQNKELGPSSPGWEWEASLHPVQPSSGLKYSPDHPWGKTVYSVSLVDLLLSLPSPKGIQAY